MKAFVDHIILRCALVIGAFTTTSSVLPAVAGQNVKPIATTPFSHQTAATQYADAGGTRLAYRRFGKRGELPLIFFQHFAGNMDNWDPQVVNGLARTREVILFDNAGVASSGGEVPTNIEGMAKHAIGLMTALALTKVDLLGFSMGSMIAQEVAIERPDLVRRLVLVGSAPRGGIGMSKLTPEFEAALAKKRAEPDELLLDTLFTPSDTGQAAGREFLKRLRERKVNRDIDVGEKVAPAQTKALAGWGAPQSDGYAYLKAIRQPVLLIDGSNDLVFYTVNAFNLQQHLANAKLIIYPDSGHGPQDRYPDLFVQDVTTFLDDRIN